MEVILYSAFRPRRGIGRSTSVFSITLSEISLFSSPNILVLSAQPLYHCWKPIQASKTLQAFELALQDEESLILRTAIANYPPTAPDNMAKMPGSSLYDTVKAIRIEAAVKLAGQPSEHLDKDQAEIFRTVLQEFEDAMNYSDDFSFARFNLGNL